MKYIISLGSNTDDRECRMRKAIQILRENGDMRVEKCSDLYETPAMGGGKRNYLNSVAVIETETELHPLNRYFKHLEKELGRDEEARKNGEVPIDIDIVMCGNEICRPKDYASDYFRIGLENIEREGS